MKKRVLIVLSIAIALLLIAALVTSYADSARVRNSVEPVHTIKIVSEDGCKVTYWGLGYKVVRYPSVSPNEPYKNNRGVKYGSWFMNYDPIIEDGTKEEVYLDTDARILQLVNFYDNEQEPAGFETMTTDSYAYVPKVPGVYPVHPIALRRSFDYIRPFTLEAMPVKAE